MKKLLLYIVALSILNQSVNICNDYSEGFPPALSADTFESFAELILEAVYDDYDLFPESADNEESPVNSAEHKNGHSLAISYPRNVNLFGAGPGEHIYFISYSCGILDGYPSRDFSPPDPTPAFV